jgi:hypothetical protein
MSFNLLCHSCQCSTRTAKEIESPGGKILNIYLPGAIIPEKEALKISSLTYLDHLSGAEPISSLELRLDNIL